MQARGAIKDANDRLGREDVRCKGKLRVRGKIEGANAMHIGGTNDQCKGEVRLRGVGCKEEMLATCDHEMVQMATANDMCKLHRRKCRCKARIISFVHDLDV